MCFKKTGAEKDDIEIPDIKIWECSSVDHDSSAERLASERPKVTSERPKDASERPKVASERPKVTSERPKVASERPKAASERPKAASEIPKVASERQKVASEIPKVASERPKVAYRRLRLKKRSDADRHVYSEADVAFFRGSGDNDLRHSLANVDIGSRLPRTGRRGSTIPGLGVGSASDAANRQQLLENVQTAIVQLFQKKKLRENELGTLQENVRYLAGTEAGPLIVDYYKDQLLKKGMVIMREGIKNERGPELLKMLGETWEYFYREILPDLQAVLYPLKTDDEQTIRHVTLLEFRNIVLLKVSIEDALENLTAPVPGSIRQMLLVLQSVYEPFPGENYAKLEKMVARVVVPYLGLRGLYMGNPEPVIKSSVRLTPKVFISSGSSENVSKDTERFDTKSTWSPVMTKKLSHRLTNGLHGNGKLAPVFEHVLDGARRHSIIS